VVAADTYRGLEPNRLLAILIAAAGAWLFFRGATPWARLGILVGAAFLGNTLIALGIYLDLSISELGGAGLLWA